MEIRKTQPTFTAVVKTEQAAKFIEKLPEAKRQAISLIEKNNTDKKIDVFVSTVTKNGKEKLKAEVGPKTFIENLFRGPVKTIRNAAKYANKLEQEQTAQNKLTQGMNIPNLG